MAKKEIKRSFSFRYPLLLIIALGAIGVWYSYDSLDLKDLPIPYMENTEITTLESKYTPEQIMESHRNELIGQQTNRIYQDPAFKYYPYLLLDVKYTADKKSREGLLLWSLTSGEIVLNTETWETTHGFKDCLECKAKTDDFKILQALAQQPSFSLSLDQLQDKLHVERDLLEEWVDHAKNKHLIIQKGNIVQLHFENPKILVFPQTQIKQHLVSKPINNHQRVKRVYSHSQILAIAQAAFGDDFKVRKEQEVFLPVYTISVLNPDGSVHSSDWNAITGLPLTARVQAK